MSALMRRLGAGALVAAIAAAVAGFAGRDAADVADAASVPARLDERDAQRTPVSRATRPVDLRDAVRDVALWPLPADAHLPGVTRSRLSSSLEDWIAGLPAADQERARRYAARYSPAYEIDDKAVQAWLLDRGFPSIEEFAAFDYARDAAGCTPQNCANPKIAALSADHFIAQLEQALPPAGAGGDRVLGGLDDAARRAAAQSYLQAGLYVDRVRKSGNVLFAAYLDLRREQAFGHDARAGANRLFIAACGDTRMRLDQGQATLAAALLQNAYGSPCNNVGKPAFPSVSPAFAARP